MSQIIKCHCTPDGDGYACVCPGCGLKLTSRVQHVFHSCGPSDVTMSAVAAKEPSGPGTELKSLLRRYLGIVAKPGCKCNQRAKVMDARGCQWCLDHMDQIVSWLKEEHTKQKVLLPFVPLAAKQLVKLAVRSARKKGTCR